MRISLIIPTYNRPQKLAETLEAVSLQSLIPAEVIVVDDGSSIENARENKNICAKYSWCRLIKQSNAGASAALNNGIRNSSGDTIFIIDDDIILEPSAVAKHASFQQKNGPCIISGDAYTDPSRVKTDVERYKVYMEREWIRKRPDTQQLVRVNFNNFIVTTANTSFTRDIFEKIGGFDESLKDGYDVDFCMRALNLNISVWFDRSISAIHNDSITLRYYAKRQSLYNKSRKMILEKRPDLKSQFLHAEQQAPGSLRKLVYSILRKNNIANFIEGSRLMLLLPKKLRYRIYGSTIAALCGNL